MQADRLTDLLPDAYDSALRWAADGTGLDEGDFPPVVSYGVEQILDPDFYPAP